MEPRPRPRRPERYPKLTDVRKTTVVGRSGCPHPDRGHPPIARKLPKPRQPPEEKARNERRADEYRASLLESVVGGRLTQPVRVHRSYHSTSEYFRGPAP